MKLLSFKAIKEAIDNDGIELNPESTDDINQVKLDIELFLTQNGVKENFYEVEIKDFDIEVVIYFNKSEKIDYILKVLDLCRQISDKLETYDVEVDLWETKSGYPYMTISYYYQGEEEEDEDYNHDNDNKLPF